MDTVEELGGTYFYAGRYNLSASELFFMIFCEQTATQLGIEDIAAVAFIHAGRNISPTRGKFRTAIPDTSLASRQARKVFGNRMFPLGLKMPSVIGGYPPSTLRLRMVRKMGTFVGRAVPVLGWIILAKDIYPSNFKMQDGSTPTTALIPRPRVQGSSNLKLLGYNRDFIQIYG